VARGRERRLIYLVTSLDLGGAEQQVRLLASEFSRRGWHVEVVSMVDPDRPEPVLDAAGIRVSSLGMLRGRPDPRGLARFVRLLRRWSPHVVHAQMVHANLLASVSHLFARSPVIVTSARSLNEGSGWRYAAYRLTLRLADVVTAVSQSVADELVRRRAVEPGRVVVVPSGIDAAKHRRDDAARAMIRQELALRNHFVWLAAGRLVAAKAYPRLVEAFVEVRRSHPHSVLLIAGDGPLESALRSLLADRELLASVQLLGRRDDVPALMSAADAYVMSSDWEGLPMALLEAASASLPTVATDVAGNGEIVIDGTTGYLIPAGDPIALAQGMKRVMGMTDVERTAIGEAARERVMAEFDLTRVADRWEAIYEAELEGRAARS
jgi:glycosyltransferase involved in cell wall biosynthesis